MSFFAGRNACLVKEYFERHHYNLSLALDNCLGGLAQEKERDKLHSTTIHISNHAYIKIKLATYFSLSCLAVFMYAELLTVIKLVHMTFNDATEAMKSLLTRSHVGFNLTHGIQSFCCLKYSLTLYWPQLPLAFYSGIARAFYSS